MAMVPRKGRAASKVVFLCNEINPETVCPKNFFFKLGMSSYKKTILSWAEIGWFYEGKISVINQRFAVF